MIVFLPLQAITVLFSAFHVNAVDTAKVVCGAGLGNKRCVAKNLEAKVVSKDERYGARCCSDTPFLRSKLQDKFGCSVYGGTITNVSGPGLELVHIRKGEEWFCPKAVTYAEAQKHCSNMGARMCTEEELNNKCAKATGCNLNQALVWASTDEAPTLYPTTSPSIKPSASPTVFPTASPTDAPSESPTGQPTPETCSKPFMMVNPETGRVVNVANGSCADGTNIDLWDRNYSNGQIFCYDPATNALINKHCNKAIDFDAWPDCAVKLQNLVLKTRSGHTTQGYHVGGQGIMGANLQNVVITNKYCTNHVIDIGGGTSNGANMIAWPSHGGWNQRWSIEYV